MQFQLRCFVIVIFTFSHLQTKLVEYMKNNKNEVKTCIFSYKSQCEVNLKLFQLTINGGFIFLKSCLWISFDSLNKAHSPQGNGSLSQRSGIFLFFPFCFIFKNQFVSFMNVIYILLSLFSYCCSFALNSFPITFEINGW